MSSPANPPSLDHLSTRPFSFYPAILGIEHNEWLFRKATWSEVLVVNARSGNEVWISRRLIGAVAKVDDPVLIVGLEKELEYRGGSVFPVQRRVLEMPQAGQPPRPRADGEAPGPEPSAPSSHGSESSTDLRILKLIGGVIVAGILLYLGALNIARVGELRQRIKVTTRDQSYLSLGSRDDYFGVVRKIGAPSEAHWQSETGVIQYQAMVYADRGYTVILMGSDRKSAAYIGTLDSNWTPVHSVDLHSGGNTFPMLRGLQRF